MGGGWQSIMESSCMMFLDHYFYTSSQWAVQQVHSGPYNKFTVDRTKRSQWAVKELHSGPYNKFTVGRTTNCRYILVQFGVTFL